jgi:hypothetical protein
MRLQLLRQINIEGSMQEPSMSKNYIVEKTAKNDVVLASNAKTIYGTL